MTVDDVPLSDEQVTADVQRHNAGTCILPFSVEVCTVVVLYLAKYGERYFYVPLNNIALFIPESGLGKWP